ncbi:hypothetical protein LX36DRAFT_664815 [Colletotrichum falcatum]|nr:hypothetical protein LX36DRAFT_664815 [Colletotrichum falcatum]
MAPATLISPTRRPARPIVSRITLLPRIDGALRVLDTSVWPCRGGGCIADGNSLQKYLAADTHSDQSLISKSPPNHQEGHCPFERLPLVQQAGRALLHRWACNSGHLLLQWHGTHAQMVAAACRKNPFPALWVEESKGQSMLGNPRAWSAAQRQDGQSKRGEREIWTQTGQTAPGRAADDVLKSGQDGMDGGIHCTVVECSLPPQNSNFL